MRRIVTTSFHDPPKAYSLIADEGTRRSIVTAWQTDRRRACHGWATVPMVDYLAGSHK